MTSAQCTVRSAQHKKTVPQENAVVQLWYTLWYTTNPDVVRVCGYLYHRNLIFYKKSRENNIRKVLPLWYTAVVQSCGTNNRVALQGTLLTTADVKSRPTPSVFALRTKTAPPEGEPCFCGAWRRISLGGFYCALRTVHCQLCLSLRARPQATCRPETC